LGSAARLLQISEDEIWDLAEKGTITLCAYIPAVTGVICDSNFLGIGSGTFEGYVNIPIVSVSDLYQGKSLIFEQLNIENHHQLQIVQTTLPFSSAMPNKFLNGWHGTDQKYENFSGCYFWIGLREANQGSDFFSAFSSLLEQPIDVQENKGRLNLISQHLDSSKKLVTSSTKIATEQTRVSEDAIQCFKGNRKLSAEKKDMSRDIDVLLKEMLLRFPDYKPMQIWRALKADCARSERSYDKENILEEMSHTELVWSNRHDVQVTLKQKGFFALLNRIKEKIND
jgi:hypothetical protein